MIFTDPQALANALRLPRGRGVIVAVDGVTGAGKTTLARQVAPLLKAQPVDLDDFLNKPISTFVEYLRLDALHAALSAAPGAVVVSGVCVLEALHRIGMAPYCLVYVKRFSEDWGWEDEDEILGRHGETLAASGLATGPLLAAVRDYHRKWLPHERAAFTYLRAADLPEIPAPEAGARAGRLVARVREGDYWGGAGI